MAAREATTVFCYAYRPIRPMNGQNTGFTLNLDDQDLLRCAFYTEQGGMQYCNGEYTFQMDTGLRLYLMRMINYAVPWLKNVPQCIRMNDTPEAEYTFGFHGLPVFRMYDLEKLMTLPFGSSRGHYSRNVYCLLENISVIFAGQGFRFLPESIGWDERIQPLEEQGWVNQA